MKKIIKQPQAPTFGLRASGFGPNFITLTILADVATTTYRA